MSRHEDLNAPRLSGRRGLSDLQRGILRHVLRQCQDIETSGDDYDRDELAEWGVAWRPFGDRRPNGSERAAMSRALRRLESRGLVQRRNVRSGDRFLEGFRPLSPFTRTHSVRLTDKGRRIAETVNNVPAVTLLTVDGRQERT